MFKKYIISKFPLTKLFFIGEHFVYAGEEPLLYCWKFENEKLESRKIFCFFRKRKAHLIIFR